MWQLHDKLLYSLHDSITEYPRRSAVYYHQHLSQRQHRASRSVKQLIRGASTNNAGKDCCLADSCMYALLNTAFVAVYLQTI